MAVCGCSSQCACNIRGGRGIRVVPGTTPDVDYVIMLDLSVDGGCEAVMDCVGAHLQPSLGYDPQTHTIGVKLSENPGNQAQLNPDGLFVPNCQPGCSCLETITDDGLPTMNPPRGQIFMGDYGAGSARAARFTEDNIHLAQADAPMINCFFADCQSTADDTLWWGDPTSPNSFNKDIPLTITATGLTVRYTTHHSTQVNLLNHNPPDGWVVPDTTPNQHPVSINSILEELGGRSFIVLNQVCDTTLVSNTAYTNLLATVSQHCLLKSTLLAWSPGQNTTRITTWTTQGGYGLAYLRTPAEATATTPASLLALGITWVIVPDGSPDADITKFITAGLTTIVGSGPNFSQQNAWRAFTLGAHGLQTQDPMFHRAAFLNPPIFGTPPTYPGNYNYRRNIAPYPLLRAWVGLQTGAGFTGPINNRWHFSSTPAPTLHSGSDVWFVHTFASDFRPWAQILQGWGCPIANPASYTITGVARLFGNTLADSGWGVSFADVYDQRPEMNVTASGPGLPITITRPGSYALIFRSGGSVQLLRTDISGGIVVLAQTTTGFAPQTEHAFTITVTPTQVSARWGHTLAQTNVLGPVNDTTFRGPYFYTTMNRPAGSGTWEAGFRSVVVT